MKISFDEMMEIVDSVQEKFKQFLKIAPKLSFQESHAELIKCKEFTDKINKKLKEKDKRNTDSDSYCTDLAATLMCQYISLMYEDTVLMAYTSKLKKEFSKRKKKKHVNKFTQIQ